VAASAAVEKQKRLSGALGFVIEINAVHLDRSSDGVVGHVVLAMG
jgi:hypothetical protein